MHVATDIRIAVAAPNGFLELDGSDNSDGVRLLPRPTYDFSMGALRAGAHTVSGATDHYTLTSQVGAVPAGVSGLTFAVTGGTFAAGQGAGCSRMDATHVSCGDLGSARDVRAPGRLHLRRRPRRRAVAAGAARVRRPRRVERQPQHRRHPRASTWRSAA